MDTDMRERPILFKPELVRAILDGRKTQTRRLLEAKDIEILNFFLGDDCSLDDLGFVEQGGKLRVYLAEYPEEGGADLSTRYGVTGDRLWVRETWRCHEWATDVATIKYMAGESYSDTTEQFPVADRKYLKPSMSWKPSIHMPRWISRLSLEITGVRVERLQDISEDDAKAEGMTHDLEVYPTLRGVFHRRWEAINGKRPGASWADNPWLWVVEFKPLTQEAAHV